MQWILEILRIMNTKQTYHTCYFSLFLPRGLLATTRSINE